MVAAVPVPTLATCLQLMERYEMLPHIRHHSLVVARLAEQLISGLIATNPDRPQADRQLVIAGALLLDEHISWNQPVGGVLIVLGAATAQGLLLRRTRAAAPSPG